MGRPRAFDEQQVTAAAAALFSGRAYDAVSIDDLVSQLGVHRNSLYKVFGSKRGLYLAALRHHLATRSAHDFAAGADLGFVLLAAVDRAPDDREVAALIAEVFAALDELLGPDGTATLLGARLRDRAIDERGGGPQLPATDQRDGGLRVPATDQRDGGLRVPATGGRKDESDGTGDDRRQ